MASRGGDVAVLASNTKGGAKDIRCFVPRLDPYGFRRALTELGWDSAALVVAERPLERLLGMIPYSCKGAPRKDARVIPSDPVMGFPRCRSVHTCFMKRSIDVAFLSDSGEVLGVCYGVEPWRVLACRGAASVLERFSAGG